MAALNGDDGQRYRFDAADCDWRQLIQRCFLGLRRYYYRESYRTTIWHIAMFKVYVLF